MSSVTIKKVADKKDLMTFIKMPWSIYKNDPYWVPPLLMEKKDILNKKKNPFFKHAEMDNFLAYKDNNLVGRISAIKNDQHNNIHNENIGFFGFFDSINDQEVADALFDEAKKWLIEKGVDEIRGPANPSSNDEYGLLIEGFDDSPRLMMPYNYKYYMDLIENYGFTKAKDLYAYKISQELLLKSEKVVRISQLAAKRANLKIRQIDMKNFKEELEIVKYVYNKAWAPNWGFVPMSDDEIDLLASQLKPIVEPSLVLFGEIDNKVVGFALVMPDYNQIFKEMNGRLLPFNFIKLFTKKRTIKWARVITLGIIPEYQKRGLDAAFYYDVVQRADKVGIKLGEASWVLEDNDMMNRGAKMMNGEIYKKYRIYSLMLK
ncbi:MAG: hypothetical protein K9J16_07370 [Melioribacteraceae bacterium]|nr:hypothetical protein [Melioribacteraceae bacterium]MCF8353412.1 hypothetical protein [Melioribacteraceae bacterium]MCF8396379.1 hypothetical protein [Melioribacteraceae bacterium]MCF8418973.1 hypothetical protein [Melioribacteraceae bacterium]